MTINLIRVISGLAVTGPARLMFCAGIAGRWTLDLPSDWTGRGGNPMRYIAAGVALVAIAGCASQPNRLDLGTSAQTAQTRSEVPSPTSAPVAQSPEAHSEGATLATALAVDTHEEAVSLASAAAGLPAEGQDKEALDLAKARQLGYRIVDKNGETLYCHENVATGSHLRKDTICLTRQQWDNVSTNSARQMQKLQGITFPCPTRDPCGGG